MKLRDTWTKHNAREEDIALESIIAKFSTRVKM